MITFFGHSGTFHYCCIIVIEASYTEKMPKAFRVHKKVLLYQSLLLNKLMLNERGDRAERKWGGMVCFGEMWKQLLGSIQSWLFVFWIHAKSPYLCLLHRYVLIFRAMIGQRTFSHM